MTNEEAAALCNLPLENAQPVRVIEDGPVRTVVEALFTCGGSAVVQRYKAPKAGDGFEVEVRVFWNEKDKLLKWRLPLAFEAAQYTGQTAYGRADLPINTYEAVAQQWVAAAGNGTALACINDGVYGSDLRDNAIRISLLRSAGYSTMEIPDRQVPAQDRFSPRMDQGERVYRFWLTGGAAQCLDTIDRQAQAWNERPLTISFSPPGTQPAPARALVVSDPAVVVSTFKRAEEGDSYIVRLFEPTGTPRSLELSCPALDATARVDIGAWEIKTLRLDPATARFAACAMLEGL
jgi:alpha-mannosidase